MGKKGSSKNKPSGSYGPQTSVTIREASTGKKQTNVKSSLKLQHIKNLAVWASHDASIPSLGAFFGHHFATSSEAMGVPVDPSLFTCQRCESILHPGYNCTIRIEKNKTIARHRGKKAKVHTRNNIVYTCHFCSHRNMKRGTPRDISPPKAKQHPKHRSLADGVTRPDVAESSSSFDVSLIPTTPILPMWLSGSGLETSNTGPLSDSHIGKMGGVGINETSKLEDDSATSGLVTPSAKTTLTLLEARKRKRNRSGAKKTAARETENTSAAVNAKKTVNTSSRRRRKSWTSLKEIAESNDNDNRKRFMNLTIPFSM